MEKFLNENQKLYTAEAGGSTFVRFFDGNNKKDRLLMTLVSKDTIVCNSKNKGIISDLKKELEDFLKIKIKIS